MKQMSPLEALEQAVQIAGGQTALALKLPNPRKPGETVKQGHVWNWLNIMKQCPPEMAIQIERAVDGQITRHQLRPDIYPTQVPKGAAA